MTPAIPITEQELDDYPGIDLEALDRRAWRDVRIIGVDLGEDSRTVVFDPEREA